MEEVGLLGDGGVYVDSLARCSLVMPMLSWSVEFFLRC